MMPGRYDESGRSDEPDRLANIVSRIFAGQSGNAALSVQLSDSTAAEVLAGVDAQDDCAVFRLSGDQELVVGTDYVRGPKFHLYELGVLHDYDLGYYLIAANVSDIAAMGARPIGVVTVVRYPSEMTDRTFTDVMCGIRDACRRFSAPNVGGDIGSAERLILSATALGVCVPGHALYRHGARSGDLVCLTGPTGIAGAAMSYFRAGTTSAEVEDRFRAQLWESWARPQARVAEGMCLGESGLVTSCQDTSDGLKAAVETIAGASGVGMLIDERQVPLAPEVAAVCRHLGVAPAVFQFGDSVDFELVFTLPAKNVVTLRETFVARGLDFCVIGEVVPGSDVVLRRTDDRRTPIPGEAWRHAPDMPAPSRPRATFPG
jgi:thiamine-monophosphate kinase